MCEGNQIWRVTGHAPQHQPKGLISPHLTSPGRNPDSEEHLIILNPQLRFKISQQPLLNSLIIQNKLPTWHTHLRKTTITAPLEEQTQTQLFHDRAGELCNRSVSATGNTRRKNKTQPASRMISTVRDCVAHPQETKILALLLEPDPLRAILPGPQRLEPGHPPVPHWGAAGAQGLRQHGGKGGLAWPEGRHGWSRPRRQAQRNSGTGYLRRAGETESRAAQFRHPEADGGQVT